ncbi:MAG TPA: metallophosphoesterase family protein, partial [bacterium]|nr:metallophosphoesterase family protein [bacterium]
MKYCFIADVHSNLPALEEIISASRKFLIDKYICLGDMVGYGPYPNETVDLIKTLVFTSCGGNHDFAAIGRLEKDDFNKLARQAIEWTESVLTDTSIKYLNTLEPSKKIEDKFEIVHGALTNPLTDYIINKW